MVLMVLALFAMTGCVQRGSDTGTVSHETLQVQGQMRHYRLFVPARMQSPVSLVVALHGLGGSGDTFADLSRFDEEAAEHGFLVVYPDGMPTPGGNGGQ